MKKILALCCSTLLLLFVAACGSSAQQAKETAVVSESSAQESQAEAPAVATTKALPEMQAEPGATNYVRMDMVGAGSIVIQLSPEAAPLTVANFQKLVSEGFYNGLSYHRAVPGFVIQGGDPEGNGMGGSKDKVKGEFLANGVFNPLKHKRGVISMARSMDMDSASSQFFIVLDSRAGLALNDKYAAFGQVVYGMEEVDRIAALPVEQGTETLQDKPQIAKVYFISKANAELATGLESK